MGISLTYDNRSCSLNLQFSSIPLHNHKKKSLAETFYVKTPGRYSDLYFILSLNDFRFFFLFSEKKKKNGGLVNENEGLKLNGDFVCAWWGSF